jgi:hypothetical protein
MSPYSWSSRRAETWVWTQWLEVDLCILAVDLGTTF